MSKQHRASNAVLVCDKCGRKYTFIKHAMKSCGARVKGVTCGGVLRPVKREETK